MMVQMTVDVLFIGFLCSPVGYNVRQEDARFRVDGELNPVPLPATLPLYGTGLGVLAFLAWRRKRRALAAT